MKIQSLSIATPVINKAGNIKFGNHQRLNNFEALKDVFEKMPQEQKEEIYVQPKIRYYYLGADDEAHETTAPFVTKQTEFGERLCITRSSNGRKQNRPFSGFTVEKNGDKEITTIYESGYPLIVDEEEDCEIISTTYYDQDTHEIAEKIMHKKTGCN